MFPWLEWPMASKRVPARVGTGQAMSKGRQSRWIEICVDPLEMVAVEGCGCSYWSAADVGLWGISA